MEDYQNCSMEELTQIVTSHLAEKDIAAVVVGGMAVALYTDNRYLTKDIDIVDISYQKPRTLRQAMLEIGFEKQGRYYKNDTTDIEIEFPSGPLGVGDDTVTDTTVVNSSYGAIPVLHAIDVVKDRLAAYFNWKDQQSLVQALSVMLGHKIEPTNLRSFCEREGTREQFEEIENLYLSLLEEGTLDAKAIESKIVNERLSAL